MIREDLLATGILILTVLFIISGIMVTVWVFSTTEDICREFPQLSRAIRLTSITLLLIMWLLIALLALYALTLVLRPKRTTPDCYDNLRHPYISPPLLELP